MKLKTLILAGSGILGLLSAGQAQASLVGDQVQIVEYYSTFGSQYGPTDGPFVIPVGGRDFGNAGFSNVDTFITGNTIDITPESSNYGTAPFNGFDIQDLNSKTKITGVTLDSLSTPFPTTNFYLGGNNDVVVNFSNVAAINGSIILDVTSTNVAAVPEPTSWVLMIAGFVFTGLGLRQRPQLRGSQASRART